MSEYERIVINREIQQRQTRYEPVVVAGALAEWNGAVANVKDALAKVKTAKQKALTRWEPGRLSAELQVYKTLAEQAARITDPRSLKERLSEMYQEAKESGDQYKWRAAGEIMQGAVAYAGQDLDDRMAMNSIAQLAARDLEALKTTPELANAHQAAAVAVESLNGAQNTIFEAASVLGIGHPDNNHQFYQALARVKQTPEGGLVIDQE